VAFPRWSCGAGGLAWGNFGLDIARPKSVIPAHTARWSDAVVGGQSLLIN
jgi:hypothetical protein